MYDAVDLFAGPGGWEVAARRLGLNVLGVEFDDAACATRTAAGHPTLQADVAALDPCEFAPLTGLIASPPCQAFSTAGKGEGRRALNAYAACLAALGRGEALDRERLDAACDDARAHLVVEPLRWALALRTAVDRARAGAAGAAVVGAHRRCCCARRLPTWSGVLEAERYGVPQTRERAILMAHRSTAPLIPRMPTHQRVRAGRAAREPSLTLEGELLPWVSAWPMRSSSARARRRRRPRR
jgi:DNA (cytosine-5)-methyltransferase 1